MVPKLDQLCRAPFIEAQESAEALLPSHLAVVVRGSGPRVDQPVVEALVIALEVVVLDVVLYQNSISYAALLS
jgi:hypothetical protein